MKASAASRADRSRHPNPMVKHIKRYTAMALLLLLAGMRYANADTLVIIGVVKGGDRVAGASVKLYGTRAQDRVSSGHGYCV